MADVDVKINLGLFLIETAIFFESTAMGARVIFKCKYVHKYKLCNFRLILQTCFEMFWKLGILKFNSDLLPGHTLVVK